MNRRNFLKSLSATALLPNLQLPSFTSVATAANQAAAVQSFTPHTYQWAEMIVRAHNKCNLGLLQRSLRIDAGVASALKKELVRKGVISAQANAYGIHTATKPLYEAAFMNVSEASESIVKTHREQNNRLESQRPCSDTKTEDVSETPPEQYQNENNGLDDNPEAQNKNVENLAPQNGEEDNPVKTSDDPNQVRQGTINERT